MVYSVCSPEPEENEEVIELFLQRHPEFTVNRIFFEEKKVLKPFADGKGMMRTFPEFPNMDGFFCTRLQKIK
jgi:16S rRNA (cytosine967-C5)-methyltransferase